ncbi:MAG: hypothetical protein QG604_860 [Candidatus Dependentiae bacterium]|nr:hypothetical protein [Candidatus Dependentiae bacterium]
MSIWLMCKAVVLAAVILVTIPFVFCLFLALWGNSFALVIDKDSQLARIQRPVIRGMIARFLV